MSSLESFNLVEKLSDGVGSGRRKIQNFFKNWGKESKIIFCALVSILIISLTFTILQNSTNSSVAIHHHHHTYNYYGNGTTGKGKYSNNYKQAGFSNFLIKPFTRLPCKTCDMDSRRHSTSFLVTNRRQFGPNPHQTP